MSEVVAYRLILTAAILLFAGGAVLASRLTKRPIRQWADITAITMLIMAAVGSFLLLTATDKAGKTYERVPATVEGQHLGKHGEMILTVKTGFDGEERDIPCLPHQKAC